MANKKFGLLAVGVLTLGLAACNGGDNAMGTKSTNGPGVYGTHNNNNNPTNVRTNRNGDGIDHNGPLTEDYNKEPEI